MIKEKYEYELKLNVQCSIDDNSIKYDIDSNTISFSFIDPFTIVRKNEIINCKSMIIENIYCNIEKKYNVSF